MPSIDVVLCYDSKYRRAEVEGNESVLSGVRFYVVSWGSWPDVRLVASIYLAVFGIVTLDYFDMPVKSLQKQRTEAQTLPCCRFGYNALCLQSRANWLGCQPLRIQRMRCLTILM